MFRPFLIRPSSGRKFFIEETIHYTVQTVQQLLKLHILYYTHCTVSSIQNSRPYDGLNEERPKHVVARTLHHVNKYYKLWLCLTYFRGYCYRLKDVRCRYVVYSRL